LFHVKRERPQADSWDGDEATAVEGLAIYVHWPFCTAKCPYCDFNSHVAARVDHDRWAAAFESEISRLGTLVPGRRIESIFFGGGTPSLMQPRVVDRIITAIDQSWSCGGDLEVTLEANPTSVEAQRFRGYVAAGVNRFSIGVQALDDGDLQRLGRLHSAREALDAVETARMLTDRVSLDLIYARQHQSIEAWRAELAQVLALEPDHLSLYQLSIEPGTAFGARHEIGRLPGLPDADLSADLFEITQEMCDAAGLPAYEVSNHARPGRESRHNLVYWRSGDYVGLGPGAHGRLTRAGTRHATQAQAAPAVWLAGAEARCGAHETVHPLDAAEQASEYLMMALRLREGASRGRFHAVAGHDLPHAVVERLVVDGLIWRDGDRIGTTARGRLLLNAVLRELL
jgi:putative oxygen-independent coproporphyrinogen III oxidase